MDLSKGDKDFTAVVSTFPSAFLSSMIDPYRLYGTANNLINVKYKI